MLLTIFLNNTTALACINKPGLKELIAELTKKESPEVINLVLDEIGEMVGIMLLHDRQNTWDKLFSKMNPMTADMEPISKNGLDEKQREMFKTGARNLITELELVYPERYKQIKQRADQALDIDKLISATTDYIDPELALLLGDELKGTT